MTNYNDDNSGTFPRGPIPPTPNQTMADAFREFPTAVRMVDGVLVPIHGDTNTETERVENVAKNAGKIVCGDSEQVFPPEHSDETITDEEPIIPVNRHPAKTFEMPGINRGRQNPDSQPVSRAEKRKAWAGMSDEEIEAQNSLNKTKAEEVRRQIAQSKKDRQNNDNQDI